MGWRESGKLKSNNYKQIGFYAYTLAEMLIVMGILAIVMLSLPTITKKVFKVEETRKPHGRFECYWDGDKLKSYYADESGSNVVHVVKDDEVDADGNKVCKFDPPKNPVYFMIYAVGAGGAGAKIDSTNSATPAYTVDSATSYLYTSSPSNWPDWVRYLMANAKPWGSSNSFDVMKTSYQQELHYRLGGSVGRIESLFIPQMEYGTTLEIIPGRGGAVSGDISSAENSSGGAGGDTYVKFVRTSGSTTERIVALLAKGGAGGNGAVIGKASMPLLGGTPGDMGLSDYASVKSKESNFKGIGENVADSPLPFMQTRITYNAGNSGRGETQGVADTSGKAWYEWVQYDELGENNRRVGMKWVNISGNASSTASDAVVHTGYYGQYGYQNTCSYSNESSLTEQRNGYCHWREQSGSDILFDCTVGYTKDKTDSGCVGGEPDCAHFLVKYNPSTKVSTFTMDSTASPHSFQYNSCSFNFNYMQISCKKTLSAYDIHNCPMPSGATAKCGTATDAPAPTGSGSNMKCEATAGQDGAVVILW